MFVTLADGSRVECENEPFAGGQEGDVFWDKAGTHVIKLYKNVEAHREQALQKVIGPDFSVVLNEPYWDEYFAWPKAIIKQPKLGITMLRIPKGFYKLDWFLGHKKRFVFAKQHGQDKAGTWLNYLSVAVKLARLVRRMHGRGLCHSDLSFNNIQISPAQNKVVLLDCDGLVVPPFAPPSVIGTRKCMAPELMAVLTSPGRKALPTPDTDKHALATLIYWLLLQRHPLLGPQFLDSDADRDEMLALGEKALFIEDPTNKANRPPDLRISFQSMLTPQVQELVLRAFVTGLHDASKRPAAADWERALIRMADSIVPCPNKACPVGAFPLQPGRGAKCPACGTLLRNPPTVPILNFYGPLRGRQGHFQPDKGYVMVGWPGRTLHVWHADPSTSPGAGVDAAPKAALVYDSRQGKWYLQNAALPAVRLLDSGTGHQEVAPGKKVELTHGARLLLGPSDCARLVYVQMLKLG